MKKNESKLFFLLLLWVYLIVTYTCKKLEKSMLVSTGEVTNILTNSADASGLVVDLGDGAIQHGHCYGTSANVTTAGSKTQLGSPPAGGFTSQLTNLTAGTKYYIKAYLSNGAETVYGKEISFTTTAPSVPSVTTSAVTSVTTLTAAGGGNITNDGGSPVTAKGVCWSIASGPTTEGTKTSDGTGTGSFTSNLTGLTPGTTYYIRAYATSVAGTGYGNELSFKTAAATPPALTTAAITGITQTTATGGGNITSDGGIPVIARGVCWNTTGSPTIADTKTEDGEGPGSFVSSLTELTGNTTYYVRSYATNSAGTSYGEEKSFKTGAVLPTVTTTAISSVTTTGAISGGNVTDDGGSPVTARGVCWSTSPLPTTADGSTTSNGTGTGSFTSNITGLTASTKYYVRAYATNSVGTAYGDEITFSTNSITSIVPGAPTGVSATAGDAKATVTFTAPVSDGGSAITGYTATSSPGGFTGAGSISPITVTGLVNGIAYTFTVTATNAVGTGPASSASNTVTPSSSLTAPGAPTGVSAAAGYENATITFTPPVSNGGSAITGYTVTSSPGGFTGNGSGSPITVTGLPALIAYTFTVTATNAIGTGPASSASNSVTPTTVPGAPTIGIAIKGNAQANVAFTAPTSDGGSAITGYTVTSNPGGKTGTGSSSPITVTGLTNGTAYNFTVTATNANGMGPASSASNSVTPSTLPGAPTIGTATAGNAQATVTYTAPASNGGSTITGYTVTSSPGDLTASGASSPITVTGLTNLTAYTFTVVATNINGNSASSAASNSVIPGTVTNPTTGRIWMDRNLGATQVATSSTDANSYGHLYQWGRGTDGHQVRTSGTTTTLSSSNSPGHGNFILAPISPNDWRSPQNDNLWQGASGTNNPCPGGYRLPTDAEWDAERLSWSNNNAAGAFASPLKLPVAGFRLNSSGSLYNEGSNGYYWSSTVSSTVSRSLGFGGSSVVISTSSRSSGVSVRCIKD